jgi:cytochrome d ubiquinol oxidase subunit I
VTFPHVISGALMTGGALMFGISAWQLARNQVAVNVSLYKTCFRVGAWAVLVGAAATAITGDIQAKLMTEQQPMKMAAAEALYDTTQGASFSVFTIGTPDGKTELFSVRIPKVLSFLGTGSFDGTVEGINDVQAQYQQTFGAGDYVPTVWITYWGFRYMIGFAMATAAVALIALWLLRRNSALLNKRWVSWILVLSIAGPFLGNSFGWIFTEMGRQPWAVFGLLRTADGVSGSPGAGQMLISFITLTVLYAILAVVDVGLMVRYAKAGPPSEEEVKDSMYPPKPPDPGSTQDSDADRPLVFAY